MNWIQRKIYLYNVTFGLYMLDWWERYLFNTLVLVLMWFIIYNGYRNTSEFCKRYLCMSVVYVLTTPMPEDGGDNPTVEQAGRGPNGTMMTMFAEHTLKHLKDDLTLVKLGSHLRIEESLKVQDNDKPKGNNVAGPSVVNMVEHNNYSRYNDNKAWWVDSGATVHACKDRCWFKTYESLNDGSILHMGNESTALVYGRGCIDLRFFVIEPNESFVITLIIKSRDAIFDENRFSSVPRPINDEMDSIMGNNTWVLADLPIGYKTLGCKWIFKRKLKVDRTVEKFKARLVIQGFKQKSRIDYFDTYALVARISTIRLLIAMISIHSLIIHQIDDMGKADVILGIRIKHESNGIAISQSHYIEKVLKKFNYFDCTLVSTLMDTSEKMMPNNGQVVSQLEYSRVIGYLIYAMTYTRPSIAFVVGKLSRFTSNPGTQHWQAIQMVLKYLKKTMDYRLTYTGYPSVLEGYTDASWISNTEDNSSTSGWVFLLGGGAIS
uniref:Zinc finger, CCHC-type n=1 Tax=Tanacetum cinerariifolium TaxID=118510 RepID=A0A6L2P1V1_TANCI|nr:zinc finger, CCHC-type [Tanacetum cinerariifolium]